MTDESSFKLRNGHVSAWKIQKAKHFIDFYVHGDELGIKESAIWHDFSTDPEKNVSSPRDAAAAAADAWQSRSLSVGLCQVSRLTRKVQTFSKSHFEG